jgi:hypothetical protein
LITVPVAISSIKSARTACDRCGYRISGFRQDGNSYNKVKTEVMGLLQQVYEGYAFKNPVFVMPLQNDIQ